MTVFFASFFSYSIISLPFFLEMMMTSAETTEANCRTTQTMTSKLKQFSNINQAIAASHILKQACPYP
jgi:hypothetical protein